MNKIAGPLFVTIAALSWSTAGLFSRFVTTDIPTSLLWRSAAGGLCTLLAFMLYQREFKFRKLMRFQFGECVIAIFGALGMLCFVSALYYTTIANVVFIYGMLPVVTYILSLLFLKDSPTKTATSCCILSFIGIVIISAGSSALEDHVGIALAFGLTVAMAAFTVFAKVFPDANGIKTTYLAAFIMAIVIAPFATYSTEPMHDYLLLSIYGFLHIFLGFGVYLLGVNHVTALAAALISLLEVLLAPIWAWLLFYEVPSTAIFVGGACIVTSAVVYIVKKENG